MKLIKAIKCGKCSTVVDIFVWYYTVAARCRHCDIWYINKGLNNE